MGQYGVLFPRFWEGTTGRALQTKGKDTVILAAYLTSNRHANMIGLYELPLVHLERELPVLKGRIPILRAFHDLQVLAYATYDMGTEHVWVREMARIRVGLSLNEPLKRDDKRHGRILWHYTSLKPNPFLGPFFERYHEQLHLTAGRIGPPLVAVARALEGGATDPPVDELWKTRRGMHGASKGHTRGIGQVQQQVQKQDQKQRSVPVQEAAAAPRFPQAETDDARHNVEVITSLMLKEVFPLLGVDAPYVEIAETTKGRCAQLGIAYAGDVVPKAYESAKVRLELRRASGGTR